MVAPGSCASERVLHDVGASHLVVEQVGHLHAGEGGDVADAQAAATLEDPVRRVLVVEDKDKALVDRQKAESLGVQRRYTELA